LIPAWCTAK